MTAAEAAAALAGAKASTSGVFTLDQLTAMGQTGNLATDWAKAAPAPGLIAGGGNGVLTATGLQAGYYQVPGQQGAEYYDPASGQASAEFVAWANSATSDQITSAFIPTEGGPQATNAANAPPAQATDNFNAEAALINAGASNEDAQNQVLGIGPNQQFVAGANGQQETMAQAMGPQAGGGYRDVSPSADTSPVVAPEAMGYWRTVAGGSMWVSTATAADIATNEADAAANASNLNAQNQSEYAELQQERVIAAAKAAGVDPGDALKYGIGLDDIQNIADTGISSAQTQTISDTYARIQDPTEQAAFLAAQDPGNLTPALRLAQNVTPQKAAEKNWMSENALAPVTTITSAAQYDGGAGGGVKTTYGDVTQTDATTGRSIMFGNVITSMSYVAPEGRGSFDAAMQRLGGALYGGLIGFIGSFGNPVGLIVGAAAGAGLLGGIKTSFKNPTGNIMKSGWGTPDNPAKEGIQNVGIDLAAAALEGGAGLFGGMAIGSALGYIRNNGQGGAEGAEMGAVSGGLAGLFGAGRQWNGGVDFRPSPAVAPGASMWTGPTL